MLFLQRPIIFFFLWLARGFRSAVMRNETAYKIVFIPGFEELRWRIGKWKAWLVFENAKKTTPAYMHFLRGQKATVKLNWWDPDFSQIPPTDKESYVKKYSIEDRCEFGKLPNYGVMIDESSGTSGTPNNWVRGPEERQAVKRVIQITLHYLLGIEPVFFINAFALGPWATGMNVSISLVDVTILKSTGPDISKIENTLNLFGPKYRYVIAGYPPFLKLLADSEKVDWSKFNVSVVFGGEGMSEGMRTYLGKSFKKLYGSYGASDLEINIGAENDFTIELRQLLLKNEALYKRITKDEYGFVPMIFQYNPLDYYVETNEKGELLITLTREATIAPKVRYNIHDLGHVWRIPDLLPVLQEHGVDTRKLMKGHSELPLLFHYGRSDMSVAFYGCKITPQNIEEVLFGIPAIADAVSSLSLLIDEDDEANKSLTIAIELRENIDKKQLEHKELQDLVLDKLREVNQDFRESSHMIPKGKEPQVELHEFAQGPFAVNDIRLKKHYIQKH